MQNKQTKTGSTSRVARAARFVGLTVGALALSFASAMQAAEMPLIADAPAIDAPQVAPPGTGTPAFDAAGLTPPVVASQTADAAGASALVEISTILSGQFRLARSESNAIAQAVLDAANRFAMSPVLLLGVIATESGFNRRAVSSAGAKGLMQVLPSAHRQLLSGGKDLSDPVVNVTIGSSILRGYLDDAGGDMNSALSRYSGGGKGYARRVALQMQQFSERLHAQPDPFVKVSLVEPH